LRQSPTTRTRLIPQFQINYPALASSLPFPFPRRVTSHLERLHVKDTSFCSAELLLTALSY
uniref:Uncharacterized protein n=1 Tax=Scleropages formosus TaxID=113540 RepID=A0A8C9TIS2_SCLFO